MIKTALVALTVVGCDCDAKLCTFISETPPQWESVAACEAAMRSQVEASHDLSYPLVTGICRPMPAQTEPVAATSASTRDDRFDEAAPQTGFYDQLATGTLTVFRRTTDGYARATSRIAEVANRALDGLKTTGSLLSWSGLRF